LSLLYSALTTAVAENQALIIRLESDVASFCIIKSNDEAPPMLVH